MSELPSWVKDLTKQDKNSVSDGCTCVDPEKLVNALSIAWEALGRIDKWHEGDKNSGMGWSDKEFWGKCAEDAMSKIRKLGEGK